MGKIYFLLILLLFSNVYSAQFALVVAPKAIIYSDAKLSSPIGFVVKGKKLRVGEVPKFKGRSLPVVVNNKLAYIEINDIQTSFDLGDLNLKNDDVDEKHRTPQFSNLFSIGPVASSIELHHTESVGEENIETYSGAGLSLKGHQIQPFSGDEIVVEFNYLGDANADSRLKYYLITVDYYLNLFKLDRFKFNVGAGINIIPFVEYQYDSYFTINGNGYGGNLSTQMRIMLLQKWDIFAGLSQHYNRLINLEVPKALGIKTFEPIMMNTEFHVGLSYRY